MPDKPNCYKCKYRCSIPGDAHSRCNHPEVRKTSNSENAFALTVDILCGKFREGKKKLNIKANQHGVNMGWFIWPANFDPVWLENCDGFEAKEE